MTLPRHNNENMASSFHAAPINLCFLHAACVDWRSASRTTSLSGLSLDRRFTANRFSDDQTWPGAEAARKSAPLDASRAAALSDLYGGISSIWLPITGRSEGDQWRSDLNIVPHSEADVRAVKGGHTMRLWSVTLKRDNKTLSTHSCEMD